MYGGYYGAWGYYDDDWMWGAAMVTTVAVVAVAASADDDDDDDDDKPAATTQGGLPCVPVIKELEGMTYYLCGSQHYVLAYSGTGPIYVPVPTPEQSGQPGQPAMPPGVQPAPPPS
jgi:hypothetical protein